MEYTILLWPHANARYRAEEQKLALSELTILLKTAQPDAGIVPAEIDLPAIGLSCEDKLTDRSNDVLRDISLLNGLFEHAQDGSLRFIAGRKDACLGEDLPAILKYKGKTNENFTQLLMNTALYSSDFADGNTPIRLLDPMCGRGTTLFVGANRGWNVTGSDIDRNDLRESEQFFRRYLEYHRFKHAVVRGSLTIRGKKGASFAEFHYSDSPEKYRQKQTESLRLVNADACDVCDAFGRRAFHLIVCDLPYGVQHSSSSGTLSNLLSRALPAWREALMPGGAVAVSFNQQTMKTETVLNLMEQAGMVPMREDAYQNFSHWVEQAVTRDIAVCRRE